MSRPKRIMVAISGASGAVYARRLVHVLSSIYETIYLTASDNALGILRDELGLNSLAAIIPEGRTDRFRLLDSSDLSAPPASGSHDYEGMVVIPCSMGVVGRIASGISNDLTTRAADVCLKERRKLILVAREMPLSVIHLRNLTTSPRPARLSCRRLRRSTASRKRLMNWWTSWWTTCCGRSAWIFA